ncbi:helix-turn-helix domain-containing protein [uncultured Microbacterium sp.]|jgi:DNA-binding HxlR family transcriptional regulator|uniref:winged helix-turn-helix transcriptional regulator n=1 Tax=uncultured Microbacterium sp. TaxID=191216 RepID=UPI0025F1A203|nr:helix-turn-helix domain-containing protein [uncultured Microbacterium sp.]
MSEPTPPFDVMQMTCPSRVILSRIGDRWTIFVIAALGTEVLRFTELKNRIGGVTPKVLTETLRALERDGLVSRETFAVVPPRVEYRLTPLGLSLHEPISAVRRWAEEHVPEILEARERAAA